MYSLYHVTKTRQSQSYPKLSSELIRYLFHWLHKFPVVRFSACSQTHRKERQHWFGGEKSWGLGDPIAFRNFWREGIIGDVFWKHGLFGCCSGTLVEQSFTFVLHSDHSVDVVSPILNHHQVHHRGGINHIQSMGLRLVSLPRINHIILYIYIFH